MAKLVLNDKSVRGLEPPASGNRIDYDVPKGPRDTDFVRGFAVRTTAAGTKSFLAVYVTADGRERRHKVGDFGPHTVTSARTEARKLRVIVDAGGDPFSAGKDRRVQAEAARTKEGATFGGLLTAYVDKLRRGKKPSVKKVEAELGRTVKVPFPALWKAPAGSITLDDLVRIANKLTTAGKWRQAEKTRSYLRAAFTAAVGARGDTTSGDLFAPFGHIQNIARDLATVERPKQDHDAAQAGDKRALSLQELRAYWQHIRDLPGASGAVLRFHLLTGAQRCEQLARLTVRDVDRDDATMKLLDAKGRRKEVRKHFVPLVPEALVAIDSMVDKGPHVVTLDGGKHGAGYHAVRNHLLVIAEAMVAAGEIAATFTPGELRITVETRLAAAGIPREVRAQLQSHGLGGVQGKHYDQHHYLDEKRNALEELHRLMVGEAAKVTPIRKKSGEAR